MCMPSGGNETCSGNGVCKCGICRCEVNDKGRFSGKYCEKCQTCSDRCQEFKGCVSCQMYKSGPLAEKCASTCTLFVPVGIAVVEVNENKDEYLCSVYDEDGCRFQFVYSYNKFDDKVEVRAQQKRVCPSKDSTPVTVAIVTVLSLFFGLAMWKLLTCIYDRNEFKRFQRERAKAKWSEVITTAGSSTNQSFCLNFCVFQNCM